MANEKSGVNRDDDLIRMLAGQLAFHQDEIHKVNGRAVLLFLGAGASTLSFAVSHHAGMPSKGGMVVVCLGGALLAIALYRHSSTRTAAQRRLEAVIKSLLLSEPHPLTSERADDLFRAQPDPFAGRLWSVNALFFVGTLVMIIGMVAMSIVAVQSSK